MAFTNRPKKGTKTDSTVLEQTIIDEQGKTPENIILGDYVRKEKFDELSQKCHDLELADQKLLTKLHKELTSQTKWYIGSLISLVALITAILKFVFGL